MRNPSITEQGRASWPVSESLPRVPGALDLGERCGGGGTWVGCNYPVGKSPSLGCTLPFPVGTGAQG